MVPAGDARTDLINRAHAATSTSEGAKVDRMRRAVASPPALDRQDATSTAGRAASILGRLFGDLQRQRPRLPLLGLLSTVLSSLGTVLRRLPSVTSETRSVVRRTATMVGIGAGIGFVLGLMDRRARRGRSGQRRR
jgi:hypothetical protein